ncbi:1-(5-phosphoribosyl)-5-[(5-phosphoribosylamino)methylideneamino]imidazole-4-carboxamide isomerase [Nonlabens ulvanivorans]|uniref:1-(5-phosphoribosyl)-5-[(5- phosphoribosylamino)methylideneamino]imidazole-4- carboxamide isomerase n=1 Tax=Nonlabens ulvanivorans TaxID=906888 RepID=UPI0037C9912F
MRIIPAIDIIDGKCVRLSQGDYNQKTVYNEDPLEVAKEFEANGIKHLHLVDLDGAKSSHVVNWKVLERIAGQTGLQVDFGGGVKTDEDIKVVFESGAKQVTGGSIAVKDATTFEGWISRYGTDKIILGADAKDGMIATHGWLESSELEVVEFIKEWNKKGIEYVICTDIAKDGMLAGTSNELYEEILALNKQRDEQQEISAAAEIKLIASGGVAVVEDLYRLREMNCEGAIVGKAFYEGRITFKELREFV